MDMTFPALFYLAGGRFYTMNISLSAIVIFLKPSLWKQTVQTLTLTMQQYGSKIPFLIWIPLLIMACLNVLSLALAN